MKRSKSCLISSRQLRRIVSAEMEKDQKNILSLQGETSSSNLTNTNSLSTLEEKMDEGECSTDIVPNLETSRFDDILRFPQVDDVSSSPKIEIPKIEVQSGHQRANDSDCEKPNDEIFIEEDDYSDFCLTDFEDVSSDDDNESCEDELTDKFNKEGIKEQCHEETKSFTTTLHEWAIKFNITLVALTALLLILTLFTNHKLPMDARTLLRTQRITETEEIGGGDYLHFGLERAIMAMLRENKRNGKNETHLKLIINVDGLPIYKSSASGFWLILCSQVGSQKVYPIGAFFGRSKPKDANEFLKKFVNEGITLSNCGVNNGSIKISIECLTCDTPAKAFVLYLKGHTGYDSCPNCNITGEYLSLKSRKNSQPRGVVCFPGTGPFKLRKDEDLISDSESSVKSVLKDLPGFGLISSVPLDYMHLVLLGVMKRLITLWITGPFKVRLSTDDLNRITQKLLNLRHSTPKEFSRRPRTIFDYLHWKATEFRTFLLYTGPIVLKDILEPAVYAHFILLHSAITILVNDSYIRDPSNVDYAEELLNEFVKNFSTIYGKQFVSQNVHNLLHLCADVRKFGSLDSFSAFRFENYMMTIKRMIRKGEKPLQQIARRYSEQERAEMEKSETSTTSPSNAKINLKHRHFNGPLANGIHGIYEQFKIYESSTYSINCNDSKDCYVLLKNGKFGMIENIAQEENGTVYFIGEEYEPIDRLYSDPDSSIFNINIIRNSISEKHLWYVEDIHRKVWRVLCRAGFIVIPLAHNS